MSQAVFVSKSKGLRLVRQSHVEVPMPNGTFHTTTRPVRYEFWPDGKLVLEEHQDVLFDGPPEIDPETGQIKRNELNQPIPTPQDAIQWIRNHPAYNRQVIGGFTELGREPSRIPDAGPRVREIIAAMAQLDGETLARYAEEEAAAVYSRPAVDAALEEALATVSAAKAAMQQQGGGEIGEPQGTPENGAGHDPSQDALAGIDKMADLKAIGAGLGLTFPPGTSKEKARELIREAQEAVAA